MSTNPQQLTFFSRALELVVQIEYVDVVHIGYKQYTNASTIDCQCLSRLVPAFRGPQPIYRGRPLYELHTQTQAS